ncbi:hypothetical protein MMC10_006518 [Thelotrema lepadinum]|nr:hypothetical protein [Thelotrema lepadinum]
MPHSTSPLEALPNELLQEIYILSQNLALPLSSPILYANLNSVSLRRELIRAAFEMKDMVAPLFDCRFGSNRTLGDHIQTGQFQGDLIGQPWCDSSILKKYHRQALYYAVKQASKSFNATYERSQSEQDQVNSALDELFRNLTSDVDTDTLLHWSMKHRPKSSKKLAAFRVKFQNNQASPDVVAGPSMLIDIKFDKKRNCDNTRCVGHSSRSLALYMEMPTLSPGFAVPSHILRGPWTRERLKRLHWIALNFGLMKYGHRAYYDKEAASCGLEHAIKQHCAPALALLVKPSPVCWWRRYIATGTTEDGIQILGGFGAIELSEDDDEATFGLTVETDLRVNETLAVLSVKVEEEHLVAALEAAEQRNDREAKVFRWLLPMAVARQYECTPRAPAKSFVLTRWAIKKEAEDERKGVVDSLGSLALKLFENLQRGTRDKFATAVTEDF